MEDIKFKYNKYIRRGRVSLPFSGKLFCYRGNVIRGNVNREILYGELLYGGLLYGEY